MTDYTKEERTEMLLIYGESGRSSTEAQRMYGQRYSEKRLPSRAAFDRLIKTFRETGSVCSRKKMRPRLQTNELAEVTVLAAVANNPHISSRQIQRNTEYCLPMNQLSLTMDK
ncbi:hypothetical protein DMN91_009242 [Ooceraea biroi]|uniref:DUF4817 domain-containing protein n=1 Tax=Ooceraea biroi TaxID=2015173 RepID=A0A3L8DEQ8_OOCBI|nr:hypothetical protein DMN91_009242 [Ooceraea biroi]